MMKLIMPNKPIRNTIRTIVLVLFALFFLVILGNTIFANKTIFLHFSPFDPVLAGGILLIGYILYFIFQKREKKQKKEMTKNQKRVKVILITLLLIVLLTIQVIIAYSCFSEYGWDCGTVLENAKLLDQNQTINTNYFSTCDNNIGVLLLLKIAYTLVGFFTAIQNYTWIAVCLNVLMMDIACLLTFYVIRKQFSKGAANVSLLFILPLLFFSPWILVPYTDTLTMAFPIAIYALYLWYTELREKSEEKPKWMPLTVLGVLSFITIVGTILKPTSLIMVIAILVMELFYWTKKERNKEYIKSLACSGLVIVLGILVAYGGFYGLKKQQLGKQIPQELYQQNSLPMTHYMMLGLKEMPVENTEKSFYGVVNDEDFGFTISFPGKGQKVKQNLRVIGERLGEKGFLGYINFLLHKAEWSLSDGTFFFGFEGSFRTSLPEERGELAKHIQPYYMVDTEQYRTVTANVMQVAWLVVQVGIIASVFLDQKKEKRNKQADVLKLALVGIICFVLLFEGRSRYLISYIPIFIVVGMQGLVALADKLKRKEEG